MDYLQQLQQIALTGTQRQPQLPVPPPWMPPLPPDGDQATALLHALSIATVATRAGRQPEHKSPTGSPTFSDQDRHCPPKAVALWRQILELESKYLVLEKKWMERCIQLNYVLAPDLLVDLLQWGAQAKHNAFRPLIRRIAGERGQWLAQMHPQWHYALTADLTAVWNEGSPAARWEALAWARMYAPEQSRTWVAGSWDKESAANRKKIAELLTQNTQQDDISLLDNCLQALNQPGIKATGTVQETKQALTGGLLTLPESPLQQQWVKALPTYFQNGRLVLPVTDDHFFNPTLLGYYLGLLPNQPVAAWFQQVLPLVPPSIWSTAAGATAGATLEALLKNKATHEVNSATVYEALTQATIRFRDPDWAAVLLPKANVAQWDALLALLPPPQREQALMETQGKGAIWEGKAIHFDWSLSFTEWALGQLYRSWMGYYFSKMHQIIPLDVYMHPDARPQDIPGLYDPFEQRDRWVNMIVPELQKTMQLSRVFNQQPA